MSKKKIVRVFLFTTFCLISIVHNELYAQASGNQPERVRDLISERQSNIPEHVQSRVRYFSNFKEYKKVHVVKLPDKLYEEETLVLYIDSNKRELRFHKNKGTEVRIIKREIKVVSDSIYIWKGDIFDPNNDQVIGDAMLVQNHEGEITGTIDVEGLFFQVRSLGVSGLSAIIEYDEEEVRRQNQRRAENGSPWHDQVGDAPNTYEASINEDCSEIPEHLPLENLPEIGSNIERVPLSNPTCPKHFARVLVLYTPGAAAYGNIDNIIAQAIEETNDAYWNSNSSTGTVIQVLVQLFCSTLNK